MDNRTKAYRIVAAQFGVAAAVSAGLLVLSGGKSAWSGLIGGLIAAVSSWYSARVLFPSGGGRSAAGFVGALYVAEALKLIMTVALLWVAMALLKADAPSLLGAFTATVMVYWLALLPGVINRPH
jgi:ATP synthase protein I